MSRAIRISIFPDRFLMFFLFYFLFLKSNFGGEQENRPQWIFSEKNTFQIGYSDFAHQATAKDFDVFVQAFKEAVNKDYDSLGMIANLPKHFNRIYEKQSLQMGIRLIDLVDDHALLLYFIYPSKSFTSERNIDELMRPIRSQFLKNTALGLYNKSNNQQNLVFSYLQNEPFEPKELLPIAFDATSKFSTLALTKFFETSSSEDQELIKSKNINMEIHAKVVMAIFCLSTRKPMILLKKKEAYDLLISFIADQTTINVDYLLPGDKSSSSELLWKTQAASTVLAENNEMTMQQGIQFRCALRTLIVDFLGSKSESDFEIFFNGLKNYPQIAVWYPEIVTYALKAKPNPILGLAIDFLGQVNSIDARNAVISLLESKDSDVVKYAIRQLNRQEDTVLLLKFIASPEEKIKAEALRQLYWNNIPLRPSDYIDLLRDKSKKIREITSALLNKQQGYRFDENLEPDSKEFNEQWVLLTGALNLLPEK